MLTKLWRESKARNQWEDSCKDLHKHHSQQSILAPSNRIKPLLDVHRNRGVCSALPQSPPGFVAHMRVRIVWLKGFSSKGNFRQATNWMGIPIPPVQSVGIDRERYPASRLECARFPSSHAKTQVALLHFLRKGFVNRLISLWKYPLQITLSVSHPRNETLYIYIYHPVHMLFPHSFGQVAQNW